MTKNIVVDAHKIVRDGLCSLIGQTEKNYLFSPYPLRHYQKNATDILS